MKWRTEHRKDPFRRVKKGENELNKDNYSLHEDKPFKISQSYLK
jgi:hypothetical protein